MKIKIRPHSSFYVFLKVLRKILEVIMYIIIIPILLVILIVWGLTTLVLFLPSLGWTIEPWIRLDRWIGTEDN